MESEGSVFPKEFKNNGIKRTNVNAAFLLSSSKQLQRHVQVGKAAPAKEQMRTELLKKTFSKVGRKGKERAIKLTLLSLDSIRNYATI